MSRIGLSPVKIPQGVDVSIDDNIITVKGKLGELSQKVQGISLEHEDGTITLKRPNDKKTVKSKHGLYRALINNMMTGVTEGFTAHLELVGVGYRASNKGQQLDLAIGYSHNIVIDLAPEIKVETFSEKGKNPTVKLSSFDKQLVNQVAAKIRSYRKPEPYKGKGIRYVGEYVRTKAGKSA
ncbi:MAG: 50S ribosomal protein L6 [Psychroflexus sp.]|jgi:large subunit ribosomal protein L6|nr:50S ribosomal protein L6 [Psychroflexus sp.]MDR9447675.1 50S ribosomal protein L6 [Psychroflexus sp.]